MIFLVYISANNEIINVAMFDGAALITNPFKIPF